MTNCCSQCSFKANFESALTMHHQLHHESDSLEHLPDNLHKIVSEKSKSMPRDETSLYHPKSLKLNRSSSATRLFGKIRARICRSKTLFAHPEEPGEQTSSINVKDISLASECTSKALNMESFSRTSALTPLVKEAQKETYGCHLCSFEADRITVLDRHLLNDHKLGLDNLLKLVLAKTKDGLSEDSPPDIFGLRQPYYKSVDEVIEDGEFVIETVSPKIKILKHAATNTDLTWSDIPDLKDNCRLLSKELDDIIKYPARLNQSDLLEKMQTLNECMCKFVDSSNTLKKVLTKEYDGKKRKEHLEENMFDLGLGDIESPREWERAHSEKLERNRSNAGKHRSEKSKLSAESYYF